MIRLYVFVLSLTLVGLFSFSANAQFADLLPHVGVGKEDGEDAQLDNDEVPYEADRYERRPRLSPRVQQPRRQEKKAPQGVTEETKKQENSVKSNEPKEEDEVYLVESKGVLDSFRNLLIGGSEEDILRYKKQLERNDIRRNYIDLMVSTVFLHNVSNSSYWYRSYVTNAPGFKVGTTVWFGPFLGFHFDYLSSLGGSMSASPYADSRVKYADQDLKVGFKSRTFYQGIGDDSNLTFFIGYFERQKLVSSDSDHRLRLATRGLDLRLDAKIKQSEMLYRLLGFSLRPYAWHEEVSTNLRAKSGKGNETFGMEVYGGKEYKFSRHNRLFWKATWSYLKHQFNGTASRPDLVTGERPENLTVEDTLLMLDPPGYGRSDR